MTTLTITPNWKNKTARFKGTVAAGEHVAVYIANDDNFIADTTNLRLRVVNPANGKTLAQFPMPEEDGEEEVLPSSETPAEGEVDWASDLTPLYCILNLNTDRMLMAVPPAANVPLLFVLDDYEGKTLYFKDMCEVTHWPRRRGEDEPVDLDDYKDLIEDFRERIDAAEDSIRDKVDEANGIVAYVTAAKEDAQTAATNANAAKGVAQTAASNAADAKTAAETAQGKAEAAQTAAEAARDAINDPTDDFTEAGVAADAKAVGDALADKQDALSSDQLAAANSGITADGLQALQNTVAGKAARAPSATNGNLAALDSNGNLTDSGKKAADFAAATHSHTASQVTGLGTAATKDAPASGDASTTQVVLGSDSRLSDSRTPTSHASSHATGGADAIAPSAIGAATPAQIGIPVFSTTATYAVGARVVSNGVLYRCTTEVSTPGPWDASKWTVLFAFATDTEPTELSNALLTSDRIWLALSVKASVASTVLTPHYAGDWIVDITLTAEQRASLLESSQKIGEDASANDYAITVSSSSILYVGTYNAAEVVIAEDGGKVTFSAGDPALGLSFGDQVAHRTIDYYTLGTQTDKHIGVPLTAAQLAAIAAVAGKADASALRYDLGAATVITTASEDDSDEETIYYGAATLADRTGNRVSITAELDELRVTFPPAVSGKLRDFGLRVEVGTGSAALTAPALVPVEPTGETIKLENNTKQIPALADGTATAKGVTLLYFSETAPGIFVVKGEQVEEVA